MIPLPQGRTGMTLLMTVTRTLTPGDILLLRSQPRRPHSPAPTIQKFTATHHAIARLLARGMSQVDVARQTGRTSVRIGQLLKDPSFCDLRDTYQGMIDELVEDETADFVGMVKDNARQALGEIQERLDDPAKRAQIPIGELRAIAGDGLDRTILPRKTAVNAPVPPAQITFVMGNRDISRVQIEPPGVIVENDEKDETGEMQPLLPSFLPAPEKIE